MASRAKLRAPAGSPAVGGPNGRERANDARERTMRTAIGKANDYVSLTKPRIISLLLLTAATTMVVANPHDLALSTVIWTMLGGYLAAGGAGAINHYLERESDAQWSAPRKAARHRSNQPRHGLAFGICLGRSRSPNLLRSWSTSSPRRSPSPACSATSSSTPSG